MKELAINKKTVFIAVASVITLALVMMVAYRYMPFNMSFADDVQENSAISHVVGWAAGIGGGLVALFMIVSIVKDGISFAKGSGNTSIFAIIGKILFLILLIGLIFLATNYTNLGKKAQTIGNTVVDTVNEQATNALGK